MTENQKRKLAKTRFGRIKLHLLCAKKNPKYFKLAEAGILRELRKE
ncbi:MAG: hypothetical protein ACFFE4_00385 [Candidatus Thorarchaeota archaeon]